MDNKKELFFERGRFFIEIIIVFIGIFLLSLFLGYFIPSLIDPSSEIYGPVYYILNAAAVVIGIPLFLLLSDLLLEGQKREIILKEDINPAISYLRLYRITKKNFKYQLLYGILILFLVFIPLDYLLYLLIPEMIDYSVENLTGNAINAYLVNDNYIIFLISVIIIQLSVGFNEEALARGFITKRGSSYVNRMSAAFISSFFFGLGHFAYFFNPISANYPFWYPIIWFLQTFVVGIMLSMFVLRKNWIFPVIFAHALNNIISAHTLWNHPNDFSILSFYLYIPLLIIGLFLFIWQFSRIKQSITTGIDMLKEYYKNDQSREESRGDKYFRIFLDFLLGMLIFLTYYLIV